MVKGSDEVVDLVLADNEHGLAPSLPDVHAVDVGKSRLKVLGFPEAK